MCNYFYQTKIIIPVLFSLFTTVGSIQNIKYIFRILSILLIIITILINLFFLSYLIYLCNNCIPIISLFQHEIGHVLGFNHPNEFVDLIGSYNYNTCSINNIQQNIHNYDHNSIMNTRKTFLNRMCISKYDKIGLFHTYKNCNFRERIYCEDGSHNFFSSYIFLYILCNILVYISTFLLNEYYDYVVEKKIYKNIIKNII